MWLFAARLNCQFQVERVPSKENIADAPSREDYCLLKALRAEQVEAKFDDSFLHFGAWTALSLEGKFF